MGDANEEKVQTDAQQNNDNNDIKNEEVNKQEEVNNNILQNENTDNVENTKEVTKKSKKKVFFKKAQTEETEELKNTINELNDKLLRNAAEFDNYKKRTLKEKSDLLKYGSETVLLGLLSIIDDFERANKSIKESTDIEAVKIGVNLIYSKFNEFINQQGIKEIVVINQEFNTDLHEAITRFPAPSDDLKGKVINIVQKGYTLNDKVIRFAKVVVGE